MSDAPSHRRLAAVGPYFALDGAGARTTAAGPAADGPPPGFRPLHELYATGPHSLLAGRVREVARRLGTPEPRVAASILHLGLAARFWSVGLGAAVLLGTVPDLDPERAYLRVPEQGPIDLWLPSPAEPDEPAGSAVRYGPAARPSLADLLHRTVAVRQLAPLAAAVRAVAPVSERLLRGNAASALVGAARTLSAHLAAHPAAATRPAPANTGADTAGADTGTDTAGTIGPDTVGALVAELLDRAPLAGTHRGFDASGGSRFRRTSCCLYYRVGPRAGVCGDCCFDRPPR